MRQPSGEAAVGLTVLTGFLGAGKTTLLNRILSEEHGLRLAVLVNDFGAINIDAELVVNVDAGMISLANGCVCCEIRDDLVEAATALLDRGVGVEHIVLEASGVADPGGIFATFNDPALAERMRVDGIVCVLDAEQVFAHPEYPALLDLKLRQVGFADMLVINKTDLAGTEQMQAVHAWLDEHFSRLRIIETSHCQVPLPLVLGVGPSDHDRRRPDPGDGASEHQDHTSEFGTWSFESAQPVSLDALRAQLRRLPGAVFRVKGIVFAADAPERRFVLQMVGRRMDITAGEPWGEHVPSTRMVAIGSFGGIDPEVLDAAFHSCLQPQGAVPDQPVPRAR